MDGFHALSGDRGVIAAHRFKMQGEADRSIDLISREIFILARDMRDVKLATKKR